LAWFNPIDQFPSYRPSGTNISTSDKSVASAHELAPLILAFTSVLPVAGVFRLAQ
jgi:hypothetical protein